MSYSRINANNYGGELRIWNFQRYQRNSMWNFQGLIKNKMEYPKCDQEKIMWKFQGSVFGIGISKGSNTILWNIQGLSLVLSGISRFKVKKWKTPGFPKKYILNPIVWIFFQEQPSAQITEWATHQVSCVLKVKNKNSLNPNLYFVASFPKFL